MYSPLDNTGPREFRRRIAQRGTRWRRWRFALGMSLLAYVAAGVIIQFAVFGPSSRTVNYVLYEVFDELEDWIGEECARFSLTILVAIPAWLVSVLVFAWYSRGASHEDEFLHCLRCGYILKGLSEPRCPECGERI